MFSWFQLKIFSLIEVINEFLRRDFFLLPLNQPCILSYQDFIFLKILKLPSFRVDRTPEVGIQSDSCQLSLHYPAFSNDFLNWFWNLYLKPNKKFECATILNKFSIFAHFNRVANKTENLNIFHAFYFSHLRATHTCNSYMHGCNLPIHNSVCVFMPNIDIIYPSIHPL